ncbi:HNH endonuclease [Streptomyces globisporus]|uniref:HNH endonuclease n=1 Tax=Streptomyces globisporus TaxID=1908 RepID=UPI0034610C10
MASGLTPQHTLRGWLLNALGEMGGSAPTARTLKHMEKRYGASLSSEDHEGTERDKEPKWHNRTRFERKKMERAGLLVPARESRGVWTLTEAGWHEFRLAQDTNAASRVSAGAEASPSLAFPRIPKGDESPSRAKETTQRIVRSGAVADYVKRVHDYSCQVCGTRLATPTGAYAEAAHIQALGRPHDGPDVAANVLCLCPNHHVLFDFGMLTISDNLTVTDRSSGASQGRLREIPEHRIDRQYLAYHRAHHCGPEPRGGVAGPGS